MPGPKTSWHPERASSASREAIRGGKVEFEDIRYQVVGDGTATLMLNRPERMNSIRQQTGREFAAAVAAARDDDDVRCLVLTGAGRGFCSGDDFQQVFM